MTTPISRIRKPLRGLWLALALTGLHSLALPSHVKASVTPLRIGVFNIGDGHLDSQNKTLMEQFARLLEKRINRTVVFKYYINAGEFLKDLKRKSLDMAYTPRYETAYAIHQQGFKPMIGIEFLKVTAIQFCLYVPKNSTAKSLQDLKNQKFLSYRSPTSYILLRKQLGAPPENAFSPLTPVQGGQSMIYGLAMGQAKGAVIESINEIFLNKVNPGPLKKIKKLGCLKGAVPMLPIFSAPWMDNALREKLITISLNAHQDEHFKAFQPLIKQLEFRFKKAPPNQLDPLIALFKEGERTGWMKDFERWLSFHKQ